MGVFLNWHVLCCLKHTVPSLITHLQLCLCHHEGSSKQKPRGSNAMVHFLLLHLFTCICADVRTAYHILCVLWHMTYKLLCIVSFLVLIGKELVSHRGRHTWDTLSSQLQHHLTPFCWPMKLVVRISEKSPGWGGSSPCFWLVTGLFSHVIDITEISLEASAHPQTCHPWPSPTLLISRKGGTCPHSQLLDDI